MYHYLIVIKLLFLFCVLGNDTILYRWDPHALLVNMMVAKNQLHGGGGILLAAPRRVRLIFCLAHAQ